MKRKSHRVFKMSPSILSFPSSSSSSSSQLSPSIRGAMPVTMVFVTFIIMSLVTLETALGEELQKENNRKITASSSLPSSSSSSSSSAASSASSLSSSVPVKRAKRHVRNNSQSSTPALGEIIDQVENSSGNENLLLYTPTTPSPENVNCIVEIPAIRYVGGRCVNLGSFIGCQAGINLALDPTCDERLGVLSHRRDHGPMGAPQYRYSTSNSQARRGFLSFLRGRSSSYRDRSRSRP